MSDFILERTWLGIGAKGGGSVLVGTELTEGGLINLGNPNVREWFSLFSLRLGIGLGASVGLTLICVFNCWNIWFIDKTLITDWGFNFAWYGKWDAVAKALKNMKFIATVLRIGPRLAGFRPSQLENVRLALHYLYNAYDLGTSSGETKVVCIDTVGVGLEVSLNCTVGEIEIMSR
ncbi:MAG: hypothetical protein C4324_02435 [Blastocatellia bacterium]